MGCTDRDSDDYSEAADMQEWEDTREDYSCKIKRLVPDLRTASQKQLDKALERVAYLKAQIEHEDNLIEESYQDLKEHFDDETIKAEAENHSMPIVRMTELIALLLEESYGKVERLKDRRGRYNGSEAVTYTHKLGNLSIAYDETLDEYGGVDGCDIDVFLHIDKTTKAFKEWLQTNPPHADECGD
jgi:hypothetical protein